MATPERSFYDPTIAPAMYLLATRMKSGSAEGDMRSKWAVLLDTKDEEIILRVLVLMKTMLAHLRKMVDHGSRVKEQDRDEFRRTLGTVGRLFELEALRQGKPWVNSILTEGNVKVLHLLSYALDEKHSSLEWKVDEKYKKETLARIDGIYQKIAKEIKDPLLRKFLQDELTLTRIAIDKMDILGIYGVRYVCTGLLVVIISHKRDR